MYRKTILSASIVAALMFAGTSFAGNTDIQPAQGTQDAQQQATTSTDQKKPRADKAKELEVITVTGVIGSQMRSIQLKRYASSIQDSISAENIGQLPDVTITDSLQRVTGVQIGRSGGEGSSLNIRGLGQVQTLLNGEVFLPASNIVATQPNFSGVPAQLFNGVDVIKSPTSNMLNSGLSGTVNLRTRHPWDMKKGWTFAGGLSGSRGSDIGKTQPKGDFLVSYNADGKWGFLLSAAHSSLSHQNSGFQNDQYGGFFWDETNGNNVGGVVGSGFYGSIVNTYGGQGLPLPGFFTQDASGGVDLNNDGKYDGAFFSSHMYTADQSELKRDRTGVNASFQMDFGGGLTLTTDAFFTHLTQNNRTVSAMFMPAGWMAQSDGFTHVSPTGTMVPNSAGGTSEIYTVQGARYWPGDVTSASNNTAINSASRNYNVQLKYDDGGFFAGEFRFISGSAFQKQYSASLEMVQSNGFAWTGGTGEFLTPNGMQTFNPGGYSPYSDFVDINFNGWPQVTLSPGMKQRLSDPTGNVFKGLNALGGFKRHANMNVGRFDGHLRFDDGNSIDFGLRNSIRTADNTGFMMASTVYGCDVMYHAFDIALDPATCDGAYRASGEYSGLNSSQLPAQIKNNWKFFSNVAGSGFGLWAMDPSAMDHPREFLTSMYPQTFLNINPQQTWDVKLHETSFYLQGNLYGYFQDIPYDLNLGTRVVRTKLHVTQNILGQAQPYGLQASSAGQVYTDRSYTDLLPTVNLALHFTPNFILRASWSKNMMPLNLNQWGGGQGFNYAVNNSTGIQEVASGSQVGSPDLDPWRSTNAGLSAEYYLSDKSMFNLAFFRIRVDSFLQTESITRCDVPDQDGVVRGRCIPFTTPVQGNGVTLHGWEFNWRQALSDWGAPGFLANTGYTVNWTYSPSNTGVKDLAGKAVPFANNSEYAGNLVLWYQGEHLQVRVAGNYRSEQAVGANYGGIQGLEQYLDSQTFVDASIGYKVNDNVTVFLKGSNLTGENQRYYLVWKDQFAHSFKFEKRYELGVNFNF